MFNLSIKAEYAKQIFIIMKNRYDLIITGGAGGNPSHFQTTIGPVRLTTNCEIGLVSMYHGEVQNINSKNNKIRFYKITNKVSLELVKKKRKKQSYLYMDNPENADAFLNENFYIIEIPEGNYKSSASVLLTLSNLINDHLKKTKRRVTALETNVTAGSNVVTVDLADLYILVENEIDSPWSLLGVFEDKSDRFTVENKDLNCIECPAVLQTDIVESSYINSKLQKHLGIIPIKTRSGWTMYRPASPYYVPITVREFSKIKLMLQDMTGNCLEFNRGYNPIITLNIRPIKGKDE